MTIRLQFDRIAPGVEVGPHRPGVETIVYVAAGELVVEHGEGLDRRTVVRAGDVVYEAPAEPHVVRNEGRIDALALLASSDPDPRRMADLRRRWEGPGEPVRRAEDARLVRTDGITRRVIAGPGDFGTATFSVVEVEIEPGAADRWHRHPGAEHALVVFQGRGVVRVGDVEETLEPLKGIRIAPGRPHQVANTGRQPLRYYVCSSPGSDPVVGREPADAPGRRPGQGGRGD